MAVNANSSLFRKHFTVEQGSENKLIICKVPVTKPVNETTNEIRECCDEVTVSFLEKKIKSFQ
jgi:hypothetical protein